MEELDHTKSGGDPPQSYPTAAPRLQKADNSANGDLRSSAIAADSAYLPTVTTFPNLKHCGHDLKISWVYFIDSDIARISKNHATTCSRY